MNDPALEDRFTCGRGIHYDFHLRLCVGVGGMRLYAYGKATLSDS